MPTYNPPPRNNYFITIIVGCIEKTVGVYRGHSTVGMVVY